MERYRKRRRRKKTIPQEHIQRMELALITAILTAALIIRGIIALL